MTERPPDSLLALLALAVRLGGEHLHQTLRLARIETAGNIRAILGLVALAGSAALLTVVSFFLVLGAVVKALAAVMGSEALAGAIVAAPFALASLTMLGVGLRWMALDNLEPRRTERQTAREAKALLGGENTG